jgi:hypothetical protein
MMSSDRLTYMNVSPEILQAALEGLEAKLSRVNSMIAEIKAGVGSGKAATKEAAVAKRTKRHVSPEARQRMAETQLKRWAKQPAEA